MPKVMTLVSLLYTGNQVIQMDPDPSVWLHAKFLQGTLFVLGAYLKMEARSFLTAKGFKELIKDDIKRDEDNSFEVQMWEMNEGDVVYFEANIVNTLTQFCDKFLRVEDVPNSINIKTM